MAYNEDTLDAFVAYRSRQLQAPRSAFQDLYCNLFDDTVTDNMTIQERDHPWVDLVSVLTFYTARSKFVFYIQNLYIYNKIQNFFKILFTTNV